MTYGSPRPTNDSLVAGMRLGRPLRFAILTAWENAWQGGLGPRRSVCLPRFTGRCGGGRSHPRRRALHAGTHARKQLVKQGEVGRLLAEDLNDKEQRVHGREQVHAAIWAEQVGGAQRCLENGNGDPRVTAHDSANGCCWVMQ